MATDPEITLSAEPEEPQPAPPRRRGGAPSRQEAERWASSIHSMAVYGEWKHIVRGHVADSEGTPPKGNSYFTEDKNAICSRIYMTLSSSQNRLLYESGKPGRVMVIRDYAPTIIGKDGSRDCTYCVAVIGLAERGPDKGRPIVFTAYPATGMYKNRQSPLS